LRHMKTYHFSSCVLKKRYQYTYKTDKTDQMKILKNIVYSMFDLSYLSCKNTGCGNNMRKVKYMGGPGCGKTYNLMSEYKTLLQSGYKQEDINIH